MDIEFEAEGGSTPTPPTTLRPQSEGHGGQIKNKTKGQVLSNILALLKGIIVLLPTS
jgi:hypothetical protein